MVDENLAKNVAQRKKRLERNDPGVISDPRSPGTTTKAVHQSRRRDQTYTKRHREKLLKGSLENVSTNPVGDKLIQESSLRRSRSLATSRETDVFTNLEIPNAAKNRRSQLIPRAKLIDRYSSTSSRCLLRGLSQESLYISDRSAHGSVFRRKSDYSSTAVPQQQKVRRGSNREEFPNSGGSTSLSQQEPLDNLETYNTKSLNTIYRHSEESLTGTYPASSNDVGLSLPNYYPDSKCDTELDNVSLGDTIDTSHKNSPRIVRNSTNRRSSLLYNEYPENIYSHHQTNAVNSATKNGFYPDNEGKASLERQQEIAPNTVYLDKHALALQEQTLYHDTTSLYQNKAFIQKDNLYTSKEQLIHDKALYQTKKDACLYQEKHNLYRSQEQLIHDKALYQTKANLTSLSSLQDLSYQDKSCYQDKSIHQTNLYTDKKSRKSLQDKSLNQDSSIYDRPASIYQEPASIYQEPASLYTEKSIYQDPRSIRPTDTTSVYADQNLYGERPSLYGQTSSLLGCYQENISYDENILLTKNTLYDKVAENNYYTKSKPRTIRGHTSYHENNDNYYSGKPRSLPNFNLIESTPATTYDSDSTLSDYDPKYYEPIAKPALEINETNVEGKDIYSSKSDFSNIENNPIYDEIPLITDITNLNKLDSKNDFYGGKKLIKTSIQVQGKEFVKPPNNPDEYKTVVTLPEDKPPFTSSSEEGSPKEEKKHSHNYLKEFLESQKGSKKPLQNFLSKKISRAFQSDKNKPANSTKKATNLIENQYFSLPDITISKNLQKCDKIDRKLRKCENKLAKSPSNRFIVNIGNHFDVTAETSIPVDFELKISKIPKSKSKKHKSTHQSVENREKTFLDAVKNLKHTLNQFPDESEECQTNKVIVNGEEIGEDLYQRDKEVEVIIQDPEKMNGNKEYQEKLHTMRNYWGNIIEPEKMDASKDDKHKCKIVGVQTKVDEVKKKFEIPNEVVNNPPSIVKITKQLFEKVDEKKVSKVENIFFDDPPNELESLNPNIVEIIEKKPVITTKSITTKRKGIVKSKSITAEPEFDHVRYRVMKSDLFQKKIFANCEKESQFDGLMQYLQDYSFQELLIDNNIVIIEPIRTNIQYIGERKSKQTRNITQLVHAAAKPRDEADNNRLKKHFFYHPIRVNREVNDDELPNPDTVNKVRQMFEGGGLTRRSQSSKHLEVVTKQKVQYRPIDPDKDRCSATDSNSTGDFNSNSDFGSNENFFESIDNEICCEQFVSEDFLEKIRACGTSITYYGGRIVDKQTGKCVTMTKAIMEEIQRQQRQVDCNCRRNSLETHGKNVTFAENQKDETYQGIKFKLLKSNSCSSRLELVGTNKNLAEYRKKFLNKQKELIEEHNLKKQSENEIKSNGNEVVHENKHLILSRQNKNGFSKSDKNLDPKIINKITKLTNARHTKLNKAHSIINKRMENGDKNENSSFELNKMVTKPTQIKQVEKHIQAVNKQLLNKQLISDANKLDVTINLKNTKSLNNHNVKGSDAVKDKNVINECIKESDSPKIIAQEMKPTKKLIQWGEVTMTAAEEKVNSGITYTSHANNTNNSAGLVAAAATATAAPKVHFGFHNYEKVKPRAKTIDEMEFEPYEIAGN